MQFIEKNTKLEPVSTNFAHLFNFFVANLEKSGNFFSLESGYPACNTGCFKKVAPPPPKTFWNIFHFG